ncbi:ABC transporter permease [Pseudoflavonifractor sp. MCC625]|uniref:ABC transporter permease n=1 Tax=Pseudoflavonifractor sp. MCC625 TaxID=2592647 RepID=UPI001C0153DF|nr:ABC transporter permease [Pseudoflavonifractor sp. MCC625]MBT9683791.1 ABC transporter permease [Pseudoflavonifractor sp. MCC625]
MEQLSYFLAATVRMATPLLIAALGLSIAERAGMMNIGAEGIMLMGAFAGYAATRLLGSYWYGALIAMIVGVAFTAIFAVLAISCKTQQVVVGAAINMLGAGITSVLYRKMFYQVGNGISGMMVDSFPNVPIPLLSNIPVIGDMLFNHNVLVYIAFLLIGVFWFIIYHTSLGLKITACGEHPKAADSLGINVIRIRYLTTLASGALLGLAGAYLSIAQTNAFGEDMTGGKGFIAMAVVILGKWTPLGITGGSLLFGAANALQMSVQNLGVNVPNNIIMMIPYVATVVAVVAVSKKKVGAPSAQGVPYIKS